MHFSLNREWRGASPHWLVKIYTYVLGFFIQRLFHMQHHQKHDNAVRYMRTFSPHRERERENKNCGDLNTIIAALTFEETFMAAHLVDLAG